MQFAIERVSIMSLKQFLFKYKHAIAIVYLPIYMVWFTMLERRSDVEFADMHCIIDDWIPFCEIFIIPYLLWFLYVAVSLLFLFLQTAHLKDFYRCVAMLILGMTTCLFIYTIFPNAQSMRPTTFARDNIFTDIIGILYSTDTATNVCPSIHVYNSIAIHVGLTRSYMLRDKKGWRYASLILCVLICLSTMFLKQHSFLDVLAAIILYLAYEFIAEQTRLFRRGPAPAPAKAKSKCS